MDVYTFVSQFPPDRAFGRGESNVGITDGLLFIGTFCLIALRRHVIGVQDVLFGLAWSSISLNTPRGNTG